MNQFTWYNPNYTVPTCQSPTGACPDTQWWFWILAAGLTLLGSAKR